MADGYYTEQVHGPHEYFDLGHFELASGFVLPEARLAYKTMGTLSAAKDNAILLPHMYTGTAAFMTAYVGPGRPLDPDKYFCILPAKWRAADVSANAGGDMDAALDRITAATTLVAFTGDLFFPPEDIRADAERIPGAKFRETGTAWGHFTMFNLREQDTAAIDAIYADVLAE